MAGLRAPSTAPTGEWGSRAQPASPAQEAKANPAMPHTALLCRRDLNQNVAGLLDELDIPRAISAPPHLDDRWAAQLVRRRPPARPHALRAAAAGSGDNDSPERQHPAVGL